MKSYDIAAGALATLSLQEGSMERSGISIHAGDFGINRLGQRVLCMMDLGYDTNRGTVTHIGPQANKEYTVSAFLECVMTVPPAPGIEVKEVETPVCACCGKRLSWPIFAFRPIVENEQATDISALVDAAAKVTLPKREDAEVTGFANGGTVMLDSDGRTVMRGSDLTDGRMLSEVAIPNLPQVADLTAPKMVGGSSSIVMTTAAERDDAIARAFIRAYVVPKLVKMLGLEPKRG